MAKSITPSKKQQFLDQETTSNEVHATQTILTQMSKTEISDIRRKLERITKVLFKSWARGLTLDTIIGCFIAAEELNKPENDGNNLEK